MIRAVMTQRRNLLARLRPILGIALVACGHGAADTPLANHRPASGAADVRAIDWRNHSYTLDELGAITVVNGKADFAINDDGKVVASGDTPGSFRVDPPVFADLDGDGAEDAVIAATLGTGGTGQFSQVMVFTVRAGKVVELGGIPGGDRGDGGIRRVALDGNAVLVDRNVLADGDGACCASTWRRERWVWRSGALAEDPAARGPLQRVP